MNDFCEGCNQRFAPIDQQACWGCKDGDLNSSKREITSNNAQIFATGSKDGRKLPENVPETNVGKINGRTHDEIKKGLEVCSTGAGCIQCPYDEPNLCDRFVANSPVLFDWGHNRNRENLERYMKFNPNRTVHDIQVIGNIFENPELLEEEQHHV